VLDSIRVFWGGEQALGMTVLAGSYLKWRTERRRKGFGER